MTKSISSSFLRQLTGLAPAVATCGALASACVAFLGYLVLGFLFLTRYYAPAAHNYVRPLHFDYSGYVAVAVAPLSPNLRELPHVGSSRALTAAVLPKSRFLPSGAQVAVHVSLLIPWDHTDLFQVTGELMSNASHVAARSTRTYINTPQPYAYRVARQLLMLPLHVLGLGHGDWARVDLPLFDSYEEREDAPVTVFRARLGSRNASRGGLPPPPVHRAEVHVRLRLGLLQTVLFWLRPGLAASLVLLVLGLSASLGGTTCALAMGLLACMLQRWMKAARARARQLAGPLPIAPAPRTKQLIHAEQPYGSLEDAVSYSLANAHVIHDRDLGPSSSAADEEDDVSFASKPCGWHEQNNGKASRQGSAFSGGRQQVAEDEGDEGRQQVAEDEGDEGTPVRLGLAEPAGWSGSSGVAYTPGQTVSAAGVSSRQRSGTEATPSSSAAPVAQGGLSGGARPQAKGSGQNQVALDREGGAERGHNAGGSKRASGTSGYDLYEDANSEEERQAWERREGQEVEEGEEEEGQEVVAAEGDEDGGGVTPAEQPGHGGQGDGKARPGGAEGWRGDLDPQADNVTAGGALRRRAVFAWKA